MEPKRIISGLISCIMSNYNNSLDYLKLAVDSICNQTYQNIEFIIVDDCSTDASYPYLLECAKKDKRITIIRNEKNLGITKSLNVALEHASGEFIARMDGDDISAPERLEKQVQYLTEHRDVVVCGTWAILIGDGAEQLKNRKSNKILPMGDAFRIQLLFGNHNNIIHPTAMFRHESLIKHGIRYDERYKYAQDYRMWVSCSQIGNCANVPEYLFQYRIHKNAVSASRKKEQSQYARGIVEEQLVELDIYPTDGEYELHYGLIHCNRQFDIKCYHWIKRIIKKNQEKHIYSQRVLSDMLWECWFKMVWRELSEEETIWGRCRYLRFLCNPSIEFLLKKMLKKIGMSYETQS